jgi:hypothetical protein
VRRPVAVMHRGAPFAGGGSWRVLPGTAGHLWHRVDVRAAAPACALPGGAYGDFARSRRTPRTAILAPCPTGSAWAKPGAPAGPAGASLARVSYAAAPCEAARPRRTRRRKVSGCDFGPA